MVEGDGSLAKNAQDPKVMKAGIRNIVDWLRSLRPPGNRKPADLSTADGGEAMPREGRGTRTN